MHGESARRRSWKAGIVVACATLVALLLPTSAMSLNQSAYPGFDATTLDDALTTAKLDAGFAKLPVTQGELVTFRATLIYGGGGEPGLPIFTIAQTNTVTLTPENPDAFRISPSSSDTLDLNAGTVRADGGYELTWTWDVLPLATGPQKLFIHIVPVAYVNGVQQVLKDRNDPYDVEIRVHPAQLEFEEVVEAAEVMEISVPDDMTVGQEYRVSASIPMPDAEVTVDIDLAEGEGSVQLSILEVDAPAALASLTSGVDEAITRYWDVTPNEPGEVALVFTVHLNGEAGAQKLETAVEHTESARADAAPPSFWDAMGTPVVVIGGILTAAAAAVGIWATLRNARKDKAKASVPAGDGEDAGP